MNYHIEKFDKNGNIPAYLSITFEANIDTDVIETNLNVIDGVKKVNFNPRNCKIIAIVYLFQDKDINIIVSEVDSVLKGL